MAFNRIGLGGVLRFSVGNAIGKIKRARSEFQKMSASAKTMGKGIGNIGKGVGMAAVATAPLVLALGKGVGVASSFEHQMSAVQAITGATGKGFEALGSKAEQMGILSAFSATEAGQAMEYMSRAGATGEEVIAGLDGVMNAAAADGINLAQSANVIAVVTKAMGEQWSNANNIADILANTSSKTNSSILSLGESFKMGAATAKMMGFTVSEAATMFGVLSDAGLKGTLAGTSFTNMMVKLSKPSSKATKILKKWNVQLTDSAGKLKPMPALVAELSKHINAIPDEMDRAGTMAELFGIRGQKAFAAFATKGSDEMQKLFDTIAKSDNAAQRMADTRLNNLKGQITLLKSSIEGASISLFGSLLEPMKGITKNITDNINSVLLAMASMKDDGSTASKVALGILDTIDWMKGVIETIRQSFSMLATDITNAFGGNGLRTLTKFIGKLIIGAAVIGPLVLGIGAFGLLLKLTVIPMMIGFVQLVSGLIPLVASLGVVFNLSFWPVVLVIGILTTAIIAFKDSNQTMWQAVKGIWNGIVSVVGDVVSVIIEIFGDFVFEMKVLFLSIGRLFTQMFGNVSGGALKIGKLFKDVFIGILRVVGWTMTAIVRMVSWTFEVLGDLIFNAQMSMQELYASVDENWQALQNTLGIISDTQYEKEKRRIARTRNMIKAESAERVKIVERERKRIEDLQKKTEEAISADVGKTDATAKKIGAATKEGATSIIDAVNKQSITTKVDVNLDGEKVAESVSRHNLEVQERRGFKTTPWQKRAALQQGSVS